MTPTPDPFLANFKSWRLEPPVCRETLLGQGLICVCTPLCIRACGKQEDARGRFIFIQTTESEMEGLMERNVLPIVGHPLLCSILGSCITPSSQSLSSQSKITILNRFLQRFYQGFFSIAYRVPDNIHPLEQIKQGAFLSAPKRCWRRN